ncbi:hypothetical protein BB561_004327 [Smittium simulii]|uniref:Uncharacterized protein n=1 Tax=Smittium simulii TaxID=133385 RepID=A0A2T9YGY7_9FUNG|nr:hypothetical protein BB561_004327 [Smittium simulii]
MKDLEYLDSITHVETLREIAKTAVSESKEAASLGLYLSEQNQVLQSKLSIFDQQITDLYSLFDGLKGNSQILKEHSLDLDKIYEDNFNIQNNISKLYSLSNNNLGNISTTGKSLSNIHQELSTLSNLSNSLKDQNSKLESKILSIQRHTDKIESDVCSKFALNLELETRVAKIEKQLAAQSSKFNSRLFDIDNSLYNVFNLNKVYHDLIQSWCNDQAESKSKIIVALDNINNIVEIFQQTIQDFSHISQNQNNNSFNTHLKNLKHATTIANTVDLPETSYISPMPIIPETRMFSPIQLNNLQFQMQTLPPASPNKVNLQTLPLVSPNKVNLQTLPPVPSNQVQFHSSGLSATNIAQSNITPPAEYNNPFNQSINSVNSLNDYSSTKKDLSSFVAKSNSVNIDSSKSSRRKATFLEAYKQNYKENISNKTAKSELGHYKGQVRSKQLKSKQIISINDDFSKISNGISDDGIVNNSDYKTEFPNNNNLESATKLHDNNDLEGLTKSNTPRTHSRLINSLLLSSDYVGIRSKIQLANISIGSGKYINSFLQNKSTVVEQQTPESTTQPIE